LCERRGNGTERAKNLREQSGEGRGSRKNERSRAERSAEREVEERARSGERRSQKWALTWSSNALHKSNRVSAEKIASYIFVLIVY